MKLTKTEKQKKMIILKIAFSIWAAILLFSCLKNAINTTRATAQLGEDTAKIGIAKARKTLEKMEK